MVGIPTSANFIYQLYIEIEKTEIKKKRPGMVHLKKIIQYKLKMNSTEKSRNLFGTILGSKIGKKFNFLVSFNLHSELKVQSRLRQIFK